MKVIVPFVAPLLCCLMATHAIAAKQKYGYSTSSSDALFDPSRVIQIEIRLDPKDWLALRISHPVVDENNYISVTERGYEYYRADVSIDGKRVKSVGVRKKGSWGSTVSSRPSLKIKFDEYEKNQAFSGLDMMTLNNCIWDPTKAQQLLAYSFMRQAGVPAPRSNLARITANGEDLGIYGHVESIDKEFIKRHFGNAKGDLYEGGESGELRATDGSGINRMLHKRGNDDRLAYVRNLADVLESPGQVSLKRVEELLDLDSFITFWAAGVLIGHSDGYAANRHNYYIYRDAKSGKLHFIPWGADVAFSDSPGFYGKPVPRSVKAAGYLSQRLWELPEVRERYRKEMRRLLAEVWEEKTMRAGLDEAMRLGAPYRKPDLMKPEIGFDQIVEFIEGRRKEVEAELDRPAPDWPEIQWPGPTAAESNRGLPMKVEGSFSAIVAEAMPTNFFGNGSATLEFTVDGQTRKPFTRFGTAAVTKQEFRELTVIQIVAADEAGELRWRLGFRIDPYRMTPGIQELAPFAVWANLIQGERPKLQARWSPRNKGTLELTQVSTNLGDTISGKFKINTTAFEEEKKP